MKEIRFKDMLGKDVVKKFAEEYNTDFVSDYGFYAMKFETSSQSGSVNGINFPNGVGLIDIKLNLNEALKLTFLSEDVQPLKMVFCINGKYNHNFTNEDETHLVQESEFTMLGSKNGYGNEFLLPKSDFIHLKILDIDRQMYIKQMKFPLSEMSEMHREILADTNAIRTIFHYTDYSLKISHLIDEVENFETNGLIKTTFLGAKALELFAYMLMIYEDDVTTENKEIPRKSDLEKIKKVIKQIDEELDHLPLLPDLARGIGFTEAKLQQSFKILFQQTVNEYIQMHRMKIAVHLLRNSDLNISEIVDKIGFNSRSYFSKLFKEYYGVSPREIRQISQ